MPNILNAIDDQYEYMTTTEQYIAQFILNHPYDIINMSVESLSKTLNIDVTKIDAFSYQFNDDGFEGLKINIQQIFPKQSLPYNIEILANDSVDKIKNKLHQRAANAINKSTQAIKPYAIDQMCKQLKRAKTIYVFGYGASYVCALDIYQKFSRIGLNVQVVQETHMLTTQLSTHSQSDCILFITNNGVQSELQALVKVIKDYHIPIMTVTSHKHNPVAQASEVVLVYGNSDENELRMGATTSLFAQMYTIDTLFYRYIALNYQDSLDFITQSKMALDNYRKHLSNIEFRH